MTKMRWATMGFMLLGAYFVQVIGCSSSPASPGGGGGECCTCTITEPTCSRIKTFKPLIPVNDCSSFCAGQALGSCSNAPGVMPVISASGAACGDGGLTPVGTGSGAGGSTGVSSEGGVVGGGNIGARCASDAECTGGMICLKPTDDLVAGTSGGFPNGICTADCSADPAVCGTSGALCVGFDPDPNAVNPKAYCLEECILGTPGPGEAKCHNRPDEACDAVSATRTACLPFCTTDADCGTRKCSAGGVCTDAGKTGLPLGSPCMTDMDNTCAGGLCLGIEPSTQGGPPVHGICSGYCVVGTLEACDWRRTPSNAGAPIGGCLAPIEDLGGGGDLGFCFVLCDDAVDCPKTPGTTWICDHSIMGLQEALNHGVCQIPEPDAGPTASGDAGGQ